MKYLLLLLFLCSALILSAAEVAVNGSFSGKMFKGLPIGWYFNPYAGHRPVPAVERTDGTLHFTRITGRDGFGVYSELFPVSPGGTLTIAAKVKGQGRISFSLHHWSKDNKWLAFDKGPTAKLTGDWKQVIVHFPIVNKRQGTVTGKLRVMFGAGHGETLSIKELKVDYTPGRYIAGSGSFAKPWQVFLPVDKNYSLPASALKTLPGNIAGIKSRKMRPQNNMLDFAPLFKSDRKNKCAWLFNEINSPGVREFTIGAGADWWMQIFVNGKIVIDTTCSGNGEGKMGISNHLGTAWLKKGRNTVAVKFIPGAGSAKFYIGGPDDLRDQESCRIVKYIINDDFEKNIRRPGSPEIVTGLISHGLLVETRQGRYKSESVLIVPQKIEMSLNLPDSRFAAGWRLYDLTGSLQGVFGKNILKLTRQKDKIRSELFSGGKKIFSLPVAVSQLPADYLLSVDRNGSASLSVKSLADSSIQQISGKIMPADKFTLKLDKNSTATVDNLCTGLAVPAEKKKTFPLKLEPAKKFDPVSAGWKLIFEEKFDGKTLDEKRWQITNPAYVALDGKGHLMIKADVSPTRKLSSGGIKTRNLFGYGWYEARLKFTRQQGWWSSFWLWGTGHNPMLDGIEIDVYEDYYTRKALPGEPLILDHNLHTMTGNTGKSWNYLSKIPAKEFEKFHTIACKRTPFEISQYLDGKLIASTAAHSPHDGVVFDPVNHRGGQAKLQAIFSGIPMRAWGKQWSDPAKGKFPEYFVVDHFRFYQYPEEKAPKIAWKNKVKNELLMLRPGAKFVFEAAARPSMQTKSPVKELFLMDNGAIISSVSGSSGRFEIAVEPLYYNNTPYLAPGRSGIIPTLDGLHSFSVFAQDAASAGSCTEPFSVMIVPDKPTRPYQGKAAVIPGNLNPAFYDEGGNGIAYSDDKGNFFNKPGKSPFRPGEDVDATGTTIGRVVAGEWLKYTVDIAEDAVYRAELECGTPVKGRKHALYLFIDGAKEPAGVFHIKPHDENHWRCDSRVTVKIKLPKGRHRLVLVPVGLFNFGTINFTK